MPIRITKPADAQNIAKILKSKPRGGLWAETQKRKEAKEKGGK